MALVLAGPAAATPVSVRIVGDAVGVEAKVDTTAGAIGPSSCPGDSAGGAIEKAVAGNWDQNPFVSTILGETHTYAAMDYWNFWINDTYSQAGICAYTVNSGDRILMLVQRDNGSFQPTVFPLALAGVPAAAGTGVPFTVTVNEQRTDGLTTTPTPVAGATVSGGGVSAQTDGAGHATIALSTAGDITLRASRIGNVSSDAATVQVLAPVDLASAPVVQALARDLQAPAASIVGIAEGQRFARGKGPRSLRLQIAPDASGLLTVKLRLTRNDRGRCTYFSGKFERFRRTRGCGASNGFWFAVGDREDTTYLLPRGLPRGHYVLDVNAIDKAYNRDDARRRGGNRIVFDVG
jgi:hypothetical protein